ncbi:ArsA family ATPase [Thermodesulfobacterium hydrogeniphilum]|uniref:ArsA family ATPase n=1 Tax=Thermodesulfobacterium hydrogeniphilum TaxID=161156 RepID=UPI000691AE48|nr:ArsA family ATPase [Thermodesulfobacterium hydrogeniphilum]
MKKIFIFLGKGGVGKTTISASLAFWLAEEGKDVFWFSVDPAHNIGDIVKKEKLSKKTKIYKNLWVQEIDIENFLKKYLEKNAKKMKQLYKQLQVTQMEKIFDIMKLSPGIEESAILYAIHEIIEKQEHDYIIIDTPPTGFTLRILALPQVNLKWLTALKEWRLKILDKRKIIADIRKEKIPEIKEDKILKELEMHLKLMQDMNELFKDKNTKFILILNQDKLSLKESERIKSKLKLLKFNLELVLINKAGIAEVEEKLFKESFSESKIVFLPFIKNRFQLEKEDFLELARYWVKEVI